MRDIIKVVDNMLKLIPASEENLISKLNYWKKDSMYRPPELMREIWGSIAVDLEIEFGNNPYSLEDGSWQQLVVKEFMGSNYQPT